MCETYTQFDYFARKLTHDRRIEELERRLTVLEQAVLQQSPPDTAGTITNSIGMKLVLIPAGEFLMGSPESEVARCDDETQHLVRITRPFYLGMYHVTQAEYERVTGTNPSYFTESGPQAPVENVSWDEAKVFCQWLSAKEGHPYRLPTEAEWEYACRAGTTTRFSFGDNDTLLADYAWHCGNSGVQTYPVGQKWPNAWGLYDMHGNVWEWCADWYGEYSEEAVSDPTGPSSGAYRVRRGGCWNTDTTRCRSAFREIISPGYRGLCIGFRVVREL